MAALLDEWILIASPILDEVSILRLVSVRVLIASSNHAWQPQQRFLLFPMRGRAERISTRNGSQARTCRRNGYRCLYPMSSGKEQLSGEASIGPSP